MAIGPSVLRIVQGAIELVLVVAQLVRIKVLVEILFFLVWVALFETKILERVAGVTWGEGAKLEGETVSVFAGTRPCRQYFHQIPYRLGEGEVIPIRVSGGECMGRGRRELF